MIKKIVSGLFTFAPLVIYVSYIVWFVSQMATFVNGMADPQMMADPNMMFEGNSEFLITIMSIYAVNFLMFFFFVGLIIFYLIDLNKNPNIDKKSAIIWTILMAFFAFITMPIYWVIHILLYKKDVEVIEEAVGAEDTVIEE